MQLCKCIEGRENAFVLATFFIAVTAVGLIVVERGCGRVRKRSDQACEGRGIDDGIKTPTMSGKNERLFFDLLHQHQRRRAKWEFGKLEKAQPSKTGSHVYIQSEWVETVSMVTGKLIYARYLHTSSSSCSSFVLPRYTIFFLLHRIALISPWESVFFISSRLFQYRAHYASACVQSCGQEGMNAFMYVYANLLSRST